MTTLSAEAGDRLRKCVLLLSSDQDGEVLSAARAIGRTLTSLGLNWHDFADAVAAPLLRTPEDRIERFLSSLDAVAAHPVDRRWIARLSRYCARHGRLSERQMAVLSDIAGRCCDAS